MEVRRAISNVVVSVDAVSIAAPEEVGALFGLDVWGELSPNLQDVRCIRYEASHFAALLEFFKIT